MGKLGFIYPEVKSGMGFTQENLGQLDMITPAGWNLIRAETVAAMQECYLRAMATPLFSAGDGQTFSPLCWTLALLLELERMGENASVNFIEMALIVQTTTPADGLTETVDHILELRSQRNLCDRKRAFDRSEYDFAAEKTGKAASTFRDYADMNMRYLKATGMVQSKGKGITLIPEKRTLAIELAKTLLTDRPLQELYCSLCNGTLLPTDNAIIAHLVLADLLKLIQQYDIVYSVDGKLLDTPAHINQVRYEIEELIAKKKEEVYASKQASRWQEISAYMDLIASRRERMRISEEEEIRIPKAEAPAYLEWSLWRAFLAIDTLKNKPYEVRRFKIDQDFMPISTAPGNGPDLIAEFEECVVVIEVTLSESSRQEAMEGEPVRRHVANLMLQYDKPVYGLFIANRIDSNTAETFRVGVWYTKGDKRLDLCIVPFSLMQFNSYFKTVFSTGTVTPQSLILLMLECSEKRQILDAPTWKSRIDTKIQDWCASR